MRARCGRVVTNVRFRLASVSAGVILLGLAACSSEVSEPETDYSGVPTTCPVGFADALGAGLNETVAVAEVAPDAIGFDAIVDEIACVVRTDSPMGANATVVMRAGLSETDVRHALWDVDFDDAQHGVMVRESARQGEGEDALLQTYGSLSSNLRDKGWRFGEVFPAEVVVLQVGLKIPVVKRSCGEAERQKEAHRRESRLPAPSGTIVVCRPLTADEIRQMLEDAAEPKPGDRWCRDVTSIDYDWQNDMLCTRPDGSHFYTSYEGAARYLGYGWAAGSAS